MKNYVNVARKALPSGEKVETAVYHAGDACGLRFLHEGAVVHDTGPRFRGRDPHAMALRGAHFVLQGTRLAGGREGL